LPCLFSSFSFPLPVLAGQHEGLRTLPFLPPFFFPFTSGESEVRVKKFLGIPPPSSSFFPLFKRWAGRGSQERPDFHPPPSPLFFLFWKTTTEKLTNRFSTSSLPPFLSACPNAGKTMILSPLSFSPPPKQQGMTTIMVVIPFTISFLQSSRGSVKNRQFDLPPPFSPKLEIEREKLFCPFPFSSITSWVRPPPSVDGVGPHSVRWFPLPPLFFLRRATSREADRWKIIATRDFFFLFLPPPQPNLEELKGHRVNPLYHTNPFFPRGFPRFDVINRETEKDDFFSFFSPFLLGLSGGNSTGHRPLFLLPSPTTSSGPVSQDRHRRTCSSPSLSPPFPLVLGGCSQVWAFCSFSFPPTLMFRVNVQTAGFLPFPVEAKQ